MSSLLTANDATRRTEELRFEMVPETPSNDLPWYISVIMDYEENDPAWKQIKGRFLKRFQKSAVLDFTPTDVFSPSHIGFRLATLFLTEDADRPDNLLFVGNTAVRESGATNCRATEFVHAELKGGVHYFGTLAPHGEELAFVRDYLVGPVLKLDIPIDGTQFRSLGLPRAAQRFLNGDPKVVEGEDLKERIAPAPEGILGDYDNFGNLKLCIRQDSAIFHGHSFGESLKVHLNGKTVEATYGRHISDAPAGSVCVYPGSTSHAKNGTRYIEVSVPRGNARKRFRNNEGELPTAGQKVILSWL